VLFGANVGTTMTGWLVAVVGLEFDIEVLALPMIGIGMLLHFTGEGRQRGALGMTLAGFGVLFLGIDVLKDTFTDLGSQMTLPGGSGATGVLAHIGAGILLTVLMQSSSATLAVALTAAQGGLIDITPAAAVVIGANIGTTATAIFAALKATSNARRAAAAHVLFNLLTGVVALLLLPWLIEAIEWLRELLELEAAPAVTLALFHTTFNVLGVVLMWPLASRMASFLARRFRTAEEDEARPRHLDETVLGVPAMALGALTEEIRRTGKIALRAAERVMHGTGVTPGRQPEQVIVAQLNAAIAHFITRLHSVRMAAESAQRLPLILRVARYYEAVAELATELAVMPAAPALPKAALAELMADFLDTARTWLHTSVHSPELCGARAIQPELTQRYQTLKTALLEAGAGGEIDVHDMELSLRRLSRIRRMTEQALKAADLLSEMSKSTAESPTEPSNDSNV
jgi:phosphate:Na+ symporter